MAPVHAILLHDPDYGPDDKGKLLFMGTDDRYLKIYNLNTVCDQQTIDIRDPSINSEHQIFCAGHSFLPDGRLLLAGGNWVATGCPANCNPVCVPAEDGWSSVFDPADNSFTFTGYIPGDEPPVGPYPATYYPTCTTEPDGSILVCSGLRWEDTNGDHCLDSNEQFKTKAWARYRWNEGSPSWAYADNLIGPAEADSTMVDYARMKVLPNGLFWDGRHQSPAQSYLWPWSSPASVQEHNRTSIYRETNNTVVLTLYPDDVAARVVMMCGGRNCEANQNANGEVIDYSEASPIWRSFTNSPPGNHKRRRSNTVLLPNGDLFLIGGQKYDASGYCPQGQPPMEPCGPDNGCPYTPVYECAMYSPPRNNPHLGTWRAMDTLVYPRMYHSIALMLPDGRVIVSGNQGEGQSQEGLTFELFYPPNFIKTDDSGYKNRPEIKTSGVPNYTFPASIAYGERFEIVVDEAAGAEVDTVMIMAPSSVTHANDMNQRRVVLQSFDKGLDSQGNRRIEVSGPKSEYFAPPGNYLLIVLDSDGVWSVGKWVRVLLPLPEDNIVRAGETQIWEGTVNLDKDFVIAPGGTLLIKPNTTINIQANTDNGANKHLDANRVEILCFGTMKRESEGGVITFTCTSAGGWYGIRMNLFGVEDWETLYMASAFEPPNLKDMTIENALYGVKIERQIAPSLSGITFSGITSDRDIYLDRSDVFIPRGHWTNGPYSSPLSTSPAVWSLLGGTFVKASNTCLHDASFGEPGKVDLIVHGQLITSGATPDSTRFGPETPNNFTANDWGGIYVDWPSRGTRIEHAVVSHAKIPVTFAYPDSLQEIRKSSVRYFQQTGIKVLWSVSKGAIIDSCEVKRGTGLDARNGATGIFLEKCAPIMVRGNLIDLGGYLHQTIGGVGLHVFNTKIYCDGIPSAADSLKVIQNVIKGPGSEILFKNCKGLKMEWACGTGPRLVCVAENRIKDWSESGVFMYQNADVQMNCNTLELNWHNLDFTRNSPLSPSEPGARLHWNTFEPQQDQNTLTSFGLRTDDAIKLELGPDGIGNGVNHIKTTGNRKFIFENDTQATDYVNAIEEKWFIDGAHTINETEISNRFGKDSQILDAVRVNFTPLSTGEPSCTGVPSGAAYTPPALLDFEDETTVLTTPSASIEVPAETFFAHPRPSPTSGITEFSFGLAGTNTAPASLRVYSVDGRLVRVLTNETLSPGYYRKTWDGRDASGASVATGIYFVRFEAAEFKRTEKVVRVE